MMDGRTGEEGAHIYQSETAAEKVRGDDEDVRKEEINDATDDDDGNGGVKGLIQKIWMGDEKAGWQKRRLEREKEELESGRSYGDLIMEQVREVFPGFGGGRGRGGDEEDGDGDG